MRICLREYLFFVEKVFVISSLLVLMACDHDSKIDNPVISSELVMRNFGLKIGDKIYSPVDTIGTVYIICVPQDEKLAQVTALFDHDDGIEVCVGAKKQISGITQNDFSDIDKGITYTISDNEGHSKDFIVKVINSNLPIVFISAPNSQPIVDKVNWIGNCVLKIYDTSENTCYHNTASIKGRGNYTWNYPKKPYALKLNTKAGLLGLSKHKRFCLLAGWMGYLGNFYMGEVARRCVGRPWAPSGRYVELVLNGKFQGMYYLMEQIKVDKDRVNITEIKGSDLEGPELTGGYLLELDEVYDEEYKFKSDIFNMPVMLRSPDENVPKEQLNYIKSYINNMERELAKIGNEKSNYQEYLDVGSFADFWMASEIIYNYEIYKPRSFYMYKGRDGVDGPGTVCKMKAGPFWDQERIFVDHWWNNKDAHYFAALMRDSLYRQTLKNNWPGFRANLEGKGNFESLLESINKVYKKIAFSAQRDSLFWGNNNTSLFRDIKTLNDGFVGKLDWVESFINTLE